MALFQTSTIWLTFESQQYLFYSQWYKITNFRMLISIRPLLPRILQHKVYHAKSLYTLSTRALCSVAPEIEPKSSPKKRVPKGGPSLQHFLANAWGTDQQNVKRNVGLRKTPLESHPYLTPEMLRGDGLKGNSSFRAYNCLRMLAQNSK